MADPVAPIPAPRLFGALPPKDCRLLDLGCQITTAVQDTAWELWAEVSPLSKLLIVGGIVLVILAASRTLLWIFYKIGGWPAVAGAVLFILGVVLAALPRPRRQAAPETDFAFGVDRVQPAPQRRPTIFDRWKWPKPGR